MSTRTVALGGLGALTLGYGAYFASQSQEVRKYEKDVTDITKVLEKEKQTAAASKKGAEETEQRIKQLVASEEAGKKALKESQIKLDAARKAYEQAEAAYKKQADETRKAAQEIQSATTKLANLRSEAERAREAVTLGEKSLIMARQQVSVAQQLYNPLNHPRVKAMMGGKK